METTVPRWFVETYDGSDQEMEEDLLKHFGVALLPPGELDPTVQEIINGRVHIAAAQQADSIRDTAERTWHRLIWRIKTNRYFEYTEEEYETLEEFLIDRYVRLREKSTERYDLLFLMEHFLPMLAKIGGDWAPENVLKFQQYFSKTKAAIPAMKKIMQEYNDVDRELQEIISAKEKELQKQQLILGSTEPGTPKFEKAMEVVTEISDALPALRDEAQEVIEEAGRQFQAKVSKVIDTISNVHIPTWGAGGVGDVLNDTGEKGKIIEGYRCDSRREVYFIIPVRTREAGLIQAALRDVVEFKIADPRIPYKKFQQKFFPKEEIPGGEEWVI